MKKTAKAMLTIVLIIFMAVISVFSGGLPASEILAAENVNKVTDADTVSVIFTHDMHSHMDADKAEKNGKIIENGGFAKLKTAMDSVKEKYPESFVLDAGDFSMGTPYQTIFSKEASELKMMKYLGFEATTFGNHEFDYRAKGLASMLDSAAGYGIPITTANIDWKATLADSKLAKNAKVLKNACDNYGLKDYLILEHNGVKAAVFGLVGETAAEYAPESGLIFKDAKKTASELVEKIKKQEQPDVIICLSHCGTIENEEDKIQESEDYLLAEQVPDIDLIISGHSHTLLEEAVTVGNTYIVSCGSYNANMGHIVLKKSKDRYTLSDYKNIPLNENVAKDDAVETELEKYRKLADKEYFNYYGYDAEHIIAHSDVKFPEISELGIVQGEETLGNLLSDSYKYAVAQAENGTIKGYEDGGAAFGEVESKNGGAQVAVVPLGVIRGSFITGDITVADAFNVSSLGYGKDGLAGYPLVRAYLTGKELKAVAEVDASVSNFMNVARLYSNGLEYSWNPNRLILNRAVDVVYNDGLNVTSLKDDELYSVIADLYSCQMLGSVKDQSFGLLEIQPKDKDGKVITNFEDHIIYDGDKEIKAWYAVASYIDSFKDDKIPEYYMNTHNRKTEIDSMNPVQLVKQPNKIAAIVTTVVIAVILTVVGIVMIVRRKKKRKR